MDQDELIQKHLEGELSESEAEEFKAMMASDDSFTKEIENFDVIETQLSSMKTELKTDDMAFLALFATKISDVAAGSAVAGAAASGSSGSASAVATKVTASGMSALKAILLSVSGIAIIGTSATFIYKSIDNNSAKVNQTITKAANNQEKIQQDNQPVVVNKTEDNKPVVVNEKKPVVSQQLSQKSNTVAARASKSDELVMNASIREQNAVKNIQIINQLKNNLTEFESKGDKLNSALVCKRLGVLLLQTGKTNESKSYFEKGLTLSNAIANAPLTADITGEYALLQFQTGNNQLGYENMNKCLAMLEKSSPDKIAGWKKKFEPYSFK